MIVVIVKRRSDTSDLGNVFKLSAPRYWGTSGNKVLVPLDLTFIRNLEQCLTAVRQGEK